MPKPPKKSAGAKTDDGFELVVDNRKARHDFFIEETFEAGLALLGTEVKSLRAHRANLRDAYVRIKSGEASLQGIHIGAYAPAGQFSHAETRPRKLLLHRREIDRYGAACASRATRSCRSRFISSAAAPRSRSAWLRARRCTTSAKTSRARVRGAIWNAR